MMYVYIYCSGEGGSDLLIDRRVHAELPDEDEIQKKSVSIRQHPSAYVSIIILTLQYKSTSPRGGAA
jgi:hypothetical protein